MTSTVIKNALAAAEISMIVLDERDRVLDVSQSAAKLLVLERDEVIGRPISDILPFTPMDNLTLNEGTAKRARSEVEALARGGVGVDFPVAVNAVLWTDPDGRRLKTVFLRDLTSDMDIARTAQKQLVQSDNAIRGANIGVFEYQPASQTIAASEIWRTMLELEPDELIDVQEEWRSRVHPADLAAALDPVRLCIEGHVERASCEYRLRSRDRSRWIWLRTDIAVAQRAATGRPSLLVGAQTDITERKVTEEALRISVEQFRSAFHNSPIGIAIVGLDGAHLLVNAALCDLLGYSASELLSINFRTLSHPEDLEADLHQLKLLVDGSISSYTVRKRYYRSDGSIMWGMLSVGMVRNAEGRPDHFVSQVVDVTEERRLDGLKNQFVSVVSHELRTPLTSILGALTLLDLKEQDNFSDDVRRLLFIAKTNGDRLHHLINDILDFEKFSAMQMHLTLSENPIAGLVEEAVIGSLGMADKYCVRFATEIEDRSLMGLVDPRRFQQVMGNLLSNAVKFSEAGTCISVYAESLGAFIRIAVKNIGPGIPDAFVDRVFIPFSQAGSVSDRRAGGTGLGLSISKQIVEQMGGEIGFDSTGGGETTFWFTVQTRKNPV